jgi:hypothetical protein
MPAHGAFGFPHGMQTLCSQVGELPAAPTVKVVDVPVGNGITCPSAVTHGSCRHAPAVLPQSASVLHSAKRFAAALVVHRFSPVVPWNLYVFGIGCPTTIGAHAGCVVEVVLLVVGAWVVVVVVGGRVVVVVGA